MLLALLLSYLLGGDGIPFSGVLTTAAINDLDSRIASVVTDKTRAEAISTLLKSARADTKKFEDAYVKSGENLTKYYKDHTLGKDPMLAELDKLERRWTSSHNKALAIRFELKTLMTREEWIKVFRQPS